MISVLVYPNITYARDLEKDSYIVLLGAILRRLAVTRPDMEFTALVPETVQSLVLPNVEQVFWPQPTYPNTMRTNFDARRFLDIVDWRNRSWDVVWSHLPEHTVQIKNALWNGTDERVPIVGYCHWFEMPPFHNMAVDTLDLNLAGIAAMESCGVNSQWLKDKVIREAEFRVSENRAFDLGQIIRPMHLGTERTTGPELTLWDEPAPDPEQGLLVWNHRTDTYAGFPAALEALDRLWEVRQDFRQL